MNPEIFSSFEDRLMLNQTHELNAPDALSITSSCTQLATNQQFSDQQRQAVLRNFFFLLKEYKIDEVLELLDEEIFSDKNTLNAFLFSKTPLMHACYHLQLEIVQKLIQKGADYSLINEGYDALFFATLKGGQKIVNFLLNEGAKADRLYPGELSLLHICLGVIRKSQFFLQRESSYKNIFRNFMKKTMPVNAVYICTQEEKTVYGLSALTPLICSVIYKETECIKALVDNGAALNLRVDDKDPLYIAVKNSFFSGVYLLLQLGAPVINTYGEQNTLLHLNAKLPLREYNNDLNKKITYYLLHYGVPVDARCLFNKTAKDYASEKQVSYISHSAHLLQYLCDAQEDYRILFEEKQSLKDFFTSSRFLKFNLINKISKQKHKEEIPLFQRFNKLKNDLLSQKASLFFNALFSANRLSSHGKTVVKLGIYRKSSLLQAHKKQENALSDNNIYLSKCDIRNIFSFLRISEVLEKISLNKNLAQ